MKARGPARELLKRVTDRARFLSVPGWLTGAGNALLIVLMLLAAFWVLA